MTSKFVLKLHEYEKAVNQRDNLIEDLTTSLQQALASRDAALAQIKVLSQSLENSSEQNESDEKVRLLQNFILIMFVIYKLKIKKKIPSFHSRLHRIINLLDGRKTKKKLKAQNSVSTKTKLKI